MARQARPQLTPQQVAQLEDELLANADRLLNSALSVLGEGNTGLARSLVILALEESGKAIGLHQRRGEIAFEAEQSPFVDEWLQKLWPDHKAKLRLAYEFIVEERYWFSSEPPDPVANGAAIGEIEECIADNNTTKQRGHYVDVDLAQDAVLAPETEGDQESLRILLNYVHQVGWQLQLREHIVASQQASSAAAIPPSNDKEIEDLRQVLSRSRQLEPAVEEAMLRRWREERPAQPLRNDAYRLHLGTPDRNPLANLGKRGHEAHTREFLWLAEQHTASRTATATTISALLRYSYDVGGPAGAAAAGADKRSAAWIRRQAKLKGLSGNRRVWLRRSSRAQPELPRLSFLGPFSGTSCTGGGPTGREGACELE